MKCTLVWWCVGRENGHVFSSLEFEVECQWRKWRPKRTWKKQVEEESIEAALSGED